MTLEKAFFILRHGSAEGEHKYFEAISVIENECNRQKAEVERLEERIIEVQRCDKELIETLHKIHEEKIETAKSEAIKEFAERLTYCKYCENYELMTSNNQHFCNKYGGYVSETDCCSRGAYKRNGG